MISFVSNGMRRTPPLRILKKHKKIWKDSEGRFWLFEQDFPDLSEAVVRWKESSIWDDKNEIVYGLSGDDIPHPVVDDEFTLVRRNESRKVTVVEILAMSGFKWTALITINSKGKKMS